MAELAPTAQPFDTYDEFVAWETAQEGRYEYDGVQVYGMSGASPRHNVLEGNLHTALRAALSRDCLPFLAGQRISAEGAERYVYADASVVCGGIELTPKTHAALNPSAIIEVISETSEARDRGDKWRGYRQLQALNDYLLVSQHGAVIDQFTRVGVGWLYLTHAAGDTITLVGGVQLPVDAVYEGVWHYPSDLDLAGESSQTSRRET